MKIPKVRFFWEWLGKILIIKTTSKNVDLEIKDEFEDVLKLVMQFGENKVKNSDNIIIEQKGGWREVKVYRWEPVIVWGMRSFDESLDSLIQTLRGN